jgi:hypothetical protein
MERKMRDKRIEAVYLDLQKAFPNLLWIRICSTDGLTNTNYNFDTVKLPTSLKAAVDENEDIIEPSTYASLSLGERISEILSLGKFRFTVISGLNNSHLLLPIGTGKNYVMNLGFEAPVSMDKVFQYFENKAFLAAIEPILEKEYRLR